MRILGTTSALLNPFPPRRQTRDALLVSIAEALNRDGATVDFKSIDTHGLSLITCDGMRYRLELDEGELLDDAEWRRDAFIGEPDPAGINGQEHPDDVDF